MVYKLGSYTDPSLKTLARAKNLRVEVNTLVTPETFWAYFKGETGTPNSAQKKEVATALAASGWPWEKLQGFLDTPQRIKRFLILHEISHLNHKDQESYHALGAQEKVTVELRACLEALKQMVRERRPKVSRSAGRSSFRASPGREKGISSMN